MFSFFLFSFYFFFPKSERRVKICVCFQEVDRRTSSFIYGHQTLATIKDGMLIINVVQYTLNSKIALLKKDEEHERRKKRRGKEWWPTMKAKYDTSR